MTIYCGKSDRGMPGSQNICRPKNYGWDGQCKDCRIKDLESALSGLLEAYESVMHSEFDYPGDPWSAEGRDDVEAIAAHKALGK